MPNQDLCYLPAIELAAAIRARRLSPVELTTVILDRITQLNPKLNAYCTVVPEAALAAARQAEAAVMHGEPLGPLHGIPVSFKDLTVTADIRTTFGSKIFEHQASCAEGGCGSSRAHTAGGRDRAGQNEHPGVRM